MILCPFFIVKIQLSMARAEISGNIHYYNVTFIIVTVTFWGSASPITLDAPIIMTTFPSIIDMTFFMSY